jgi:hypothetical protein
VIQKIGVTTFSKMGQLSEADVINRINPLGGPSPRPLAAYLHSLARINARQSDRIRLHYARLSRSVGAGTDPEGSGGPFGDAPFHPTSPSLACALSFVCARLESPKEISPSK